ncbi:uncharacterized protein OCT59_029823 [Rhizophagus irregularis]|uniref:uncharacterized protein n=1 Tax=Rhizophagus irregularis TaxID=588596 RepID=UPI0033313D7B|nr:hypothetical protein OCT59_029823 [Rhizophagus irregularis]
MSFIRNKLVSDAINNAYLLIDYDKNEEGQYESIKQTILSDESLSHDEKLEAINIIRIGLTRLDLILLSTINMDQ